MFIVLGWFDIFIFELKPDLGPDFTNFEMRVHLDDLHLLLFVCIKIVLVKTNPVKNAENDQSYIVLLNFLLDPID